MELLTKPELSLRKREILEKIRKGAVFIHPTDTIYGLSCDATNSAAVKKIRRLKERQTTPFSVWVPSLDWIKQNCCPSPALNKWLKELPGAYTLITKLKNKKSVSPQVNPNSPTLGIRIPDHWFHEIVKELNIPVVTTSANKTGQPFMTSLEDLDSDIKKELDFIIYEGEKNGRPSKIINLEEEKVIER